MDEEQISAQTRRVLEAMRQNTELCLNQARSLDATTEVVAIKYALETALAEIEAEL